MDLPDLLWLRGWIRINSHFSQRLMSSTTLKICAASSLFYVAKLALLAVKQVSICLWNTYQGAVLHFQAVLCLKFPLCPNKVSHSANTPPRSFVSREHEGDPLVLWRCLNGLPRWDVVPNSRQVFLQRSALWHKGPLRSGLPSPWSCMVLCGCTSAPSSGSITCCWLIFHWLNFSCAEETRFHSVGRLSHREFLIPHYPAKFSSAFSIWSDGCCEEPASALASLNW